MSMTTGTVGSYTAMHNHPQAATIARSCNDLAAYNPAGQIDDVKIFNYALTPQQIRNEYNSGAVNFGN